MSATLEYFRAKDPSLKDLPDDELTAYIGENAPEMLEADEEFAADYWKGFAGEAPSLEPMRPGSPMELKAQEPPPGDTMSAIKEQQARAMAEGAEGVYTGQAPAAMGVQAPTPEGFGQDDAMAAAHAEWLAQQHAKLVEQSREHPLAQAGAQVGRAGKVTLGAAADLATLYPGGPEPSAENLRSFANDPQAPMLVEHGLEELHGLGSIPTKAAAGLLRAIPAIGVAGGAAALGAPSAVAAGLPMLVNEQGDVDPVGALIAAGLPGVSRAGEKVVANQLAKMPVVEVLFQNGLKLKGKVTQRLGGSIEISNDVFRKWLETGGGVAAANAYLLASNMPQVLALPEGERGEAILDAVAGNIGPSLIGFASRPGVSRTLEQLYPKLRMEWAKANAPQPKPQPGRMLERQPSMPAEEGAPVPEWGMEIVKKASAAPAAPTTAPTGGTPTATPPTTTVPAQPPAETTPPSAPAPSRQTVPTAPPAPQPGAAVNPVVVDAEAPPERQVVLGKEAKVKGTADQVFSARYAWMPFDAINASHTGTDFQVNPRYAPLVNTREYDKDQGEREKVVDGANNFDPPDYVIYSQSAAMGPLMVAAGHDGVVRVLGGNGRKQMMDRLRPEQRDALGQLMDAEAATFGLGPRPTSGHALVRLFSPIDLQTPEGVLAARQLVDALNPSPGRVETTAKLAENDSLKVPLDAALKITPQSGYSLQKEWLAKLIADGHVDRNTRGKLLEDKSELDNYVQRFLIHKAYQTNAIVELRNSRYTPATLAGFIDSSTPMILQLRAAGNEGETVAKAWVELFNRIAEKQMVQQDRKINRVLQEIADQGEVGESHATALGRRVAAVLSAMVEFHPPNKRGEVKVDEEDTTRAWRDFMRRLTKQVVTWKQENTGGASLLGEDYKLMQMLEIFLKAEGGVMMGGELGGATVAEDVRPFEAGTTPPPREPETQRKRLSWRWRQMTRLKPGDLAQYGSDSVKMTLRVREVKRTNNRAEAELVLEDPHDPKKWVRLYLREETDIYSLALHEEGRKFESGPDPRVKRYKELARLREKLAGRLPRNLEQEMAELEQALGQDFMAFWAAQSAARPEAPDLTRAQIEARQKERLTAGPLSTQDELIPAPGQMSLFEEVAACGEDLGNVTEVAAILEDAAVLDQAKDKVSVDRWVATARALRAKMVSTLQGLEADDRHVAGLWNSLPYGSLQATLVMDAYMQVAGLTPETVVFEFEHAYVGNATAGALGKQRASKKSFGDLIGIHADASLARPQEPGDQAHVLLAMKLTNPWHQRVATRNELKAALGPKLVRKAMENSLQEFSATAEEARQILAVTGYSPAQFWRAVRNGDVALANRLAAANRPRRKYYLAKRMAMGPLPEAPLDIPPQMQLLEGTEQFLPGLRIVSKGPENETRATNPEIEGPGAAARRRDRQLRFGGLGDAGKSRARAGGGAAGSEGSGPAGGLTRALEHHIFGRQPHEPNIYRRFLESGTGRKEVIWARRRLVPTRFQINGKNGVTEWIRRADPMSRVLDPHQKEGVLRAADALLGWTNAPNNHYGIFDGTGAGKTMQEVAIADIVARVTGEPVLILTERQAIIDDAFAKDAEALGITIHQWKGGELEPGQRILLATYFDVQGNKVPDGVFRTIIFDEAHALRNVLTADKAKKSLALAQGAKRVLYATATPLDKPEQLWYLAPLLGETPEAALLRIGIETKWVRRRGREQRVFRYVKGITQGQVQHNMERMFDEMYVQGRAIKREVPLDNLTVNLKRVHIDPESQREVGDIMEAAEALYRNRGVPEVMIKGLKMMVGRQALEKHKVAEALRMVDEVMARGKKVLLYAYRVEDGIWVENNGLRAISDMLEKKYGTGSVGRLFGGGNTIKEQRYRQQVLKDFQHGDLRIIVAHPQVAGTGINADDIYGDAPREMILITPPFSALEMVQLAGRVARLTTKSDAIVHLLLTDMKVDNWNLDIYLRKFRLLRAAVKGDIDRLQPEEVYEETKIPGSAELSGPRRTKADPNQIEFEWREDLGLLGRLEHYPMPGGVAKSNLGSLPGLPGGTTAEQAEAVELTARAIKDSFIETGKVELVGQQCTDAAQAAVLARVIRSKKFETTLWVFVKDGQVMDQYAVTRRVPNSTVTSRTQDNAYLSDLINKADGVYIFHNHPTGNPQPSPQDRHAAKLFYSSMGSKLLGFGVINHRKAALIDKYGQVQIGEIPGIDGPDPLMEDTKGKPRILGQRIEDFSTRGVMIAAQGLLHDPERVTLIMTDGNGVVRGLGRLRISAMQGPGWVEQVREQLRKMALNTGAFYVFGYHDGHQDLREPLRALLKAGALYEAVDMRHLTNGNLGIASAEVFTPDEWLLRDPHHGWMGMPEKKFSEIRLAERTRKFNADTMEVSGLQWRETVAAAKTGSHPKGTPVLKGSAIALGGMTHVRPVEMPELVRLVQELAGELPKIKKMRGGVVGRMTGSGEGHITLDWRIFGDEETAAKVLQHEMGHLVDYLPDHVLTRGNLIGRLLTLRHFLKNTFGGVGVTNKVLRDELLNVTMYWHPYDPATAPASYVQYRRSAVELYADALSVLFNSPGLLQQMAPKFYQEFWENLNTKPEVKQALFNLQDFLSRGKVTVLEQREAEVEKMFADGEEIFRAKVSARKERAKSFEGFWMDLAQQAIDRFMPSLARAKAAAKGGAAWKPGRDPRDVLDAHGLRETVTYRWLRRLHERVIAPMEAEGFTMEDMGKILLWERILAGDRNVLANPLGLTPGTARQALMKWRLDRGLDAWTLMKRHVADFHEMVFDVITQAVEVGAYNDKVYKERLLPNKDFYAAFAVLDYLEDYIPAGIKSQIGTFKPVANPFISTVLKVASLQNLISWQEAKNVVIDQLMLRHFPGEIELAKTTGPIFSRRPVPKAGKGILMRLENGMPVFYYVDPYTADAFTMIHPGHLRRVVKFLDYVFRSALYPLYITYSAGFMLAMSPMRDYQRTAQNLTQMKFARARLWMDYLRGFAAARSRFTGKAHPIIREMEANLALGTPFDTFSGMWREDAMADIMRRYQLMPNDEARGLYDRYVFHPINQALRGLDAVGSFMDAKLQALTGWSLAPAHALLHPLDFVEFYGMTLDTLPKVAAYKVLRKRKVSPREAAQFVRNYVGLPAVHRKGIALETIRALVPFWNVAVQGYRADARLATEPKTKSAWWLRWALQDGWLAMIQGLAASGVLGAAIKELLDGISEYRKTNYLTIPVGTSPGGEFGKRVAFLQIPRHESSRLLSGVTYKFFSVLKGGQLDNIPSELFDFGAGQFPSFNPVLTIPANWGALAAGNNPKDFFRGQPIVPPTEFEAGPEHRLAPMFKWTFDESGLGNFITFDSRSQTLFQLGISATPGVNRFVKFSDFGYREQQHESQAEEREIRAEEKLKLPPEVRRLSSEYWRLKSLRPEMRTPKQEDRWIQVSTWYGAVYRPNMEALAVAKDAKDPAEEKSVRQILQEQSQAFAPQK